MEIKAIHTTGQRDVRLEASDFRREFGELMLRNVGRIRDDRGQLTLHTRYAKGPAEITGQERDAIPHTVSFRIPLRSE